MGSRREIPEDGCLDLLPNSGSNLALNMIIVEVPNEIKLLGELTLQLGISDRSKEEKWLPDHHLEKLLPELPKLNVPKTAVPEEKKIKVVTKTGASNRHRPRKNFRHRRVQKNKFSANCRSKPPRKKFRSDRLDNPRANSQSVDIEPWIDKPWENQAFFSAINTATPVNTAPAVSNMTLNNYYASTPPPSHFTPGPSSNIYNSNNNAHKRPKAHIRPSRVSNIPLNNHIGHQQHPTPTNRMPCPRPSFPPPNRFLPQHPTSGGFSGPSPKMGFNGPRCNGKHGLLGDRPSPDMVFNRNLARYPNSMSSQSNPNRNSANFGPRFYPS